MTNLRPSQMRAAPASGRSRLGAWAGGLALTLGLMGGASSAAAQASTNTPPAPPPPRAQAPAAEPQLPASLRPPTVSPPPAGRPATAAPAASASVAGGQSAARPAVAAPPRPSLLPDSLRPRTTVAATPAPPADGVALCRDGTYLVPPATVSDCASHRGLQVGMPPRAAAPPARVAQAQAQAAPSVALANVAPPAGATMRCKDGSYQSGAPSAGACSGRGGLAAAMPPTGAAPPQPMAPRQNPRSPGGRAPQTARPAAQPAASPPQPVKPSQPASKAQPRRPEAPAPQP